MRTYTLVGGEWLTPNTYQITLKAPDNNAGFDFLPGQYAALSFQKDWRYSPARCFSMVSSPNETNILQFAMRTNGRYTKSVAKTAPGTQVKVRGPYGGFVFDTNNQNLVMLAGGIGITPFMSMVSYATEISLNNNITLVYSCQSEAEASFYQKLIELERANPRLRVIFAVTDGKISNLAGQNHIQGRITPEIIAKIRQSQPADTPYYVCGPPAFMKAMARELSRQGVSAANILTEAFSQGSSRQTGRLRSWPYNVYALTSLSLVFGSLVVMGGDLIKTLPKSTTQANTNSKSPTTPELTNNRQQTLDNAINSVPANTTNTAAQPAAATGSTTAPAQPISTTPSVPTATVQPRTKAS